MCNDCQAMWEALAAPAPPVHLPDAVEQAEALCWAVLA